MIVIEMSDCPAGAVPCDCFVSSTWPVFEMHLNALYGSTTGILTSARVNRLLNYSRVFFDPCTSSVDAALPLDSPEMMARAELFFHAHTHPYD